jgi:hypothetical protein
MCEICSSFPATLEEMTKSQIKKAFIKIGKALEKEKNQKKIDHLLEISDKILDKEVPFLESDSELDKLWQEED